MDSPEKVYLFMRREWDALQPVMMMSGMEIELKTKQQNIVWSQK